MQNNSSEKKYIELVVISGKGGTGKTSLTACFAALAQQSVLGDCDVDAADLHLILKPKVKRSGAFSGGVLAEIDQRKCNRCAKCKEICRFSAIEKKEDKFFVNSLLCEGCGVCQMVCESAAVNLNEYVNGRWFVSETRFGDMSHAELGIAEENSGKLVSLVKDNAHALAKDKVLLDGAPGTGCPVIASLAGVDYALVVTEPTVSGFHDLKRIIEVTRHFRIKSGVVINKSDLNLEESEQIEDFAKESQIEFLGSIPYDKKVTEAQINGLSLVEYTKGGTAEAIEEIWKRVKQSAGIY